MLRNVCNNVYTPEEAAINTMTTTQSRAVSVIAIADYLDENHSMSASIVVERRTFSRY